MFLFSLGVLTGAVITVTVLLWIAIRAYRRFLG